MSIAALKNAGYTPNFNAPITAKDLAEDSADMPRGEELSGRFHAAVRKEEFLDLDQAAMAVIFHLQWGGRCSCYSASTVLRSHADQVMWAAAMQWAHVVAVLPVDVTCICTYSLSSRQAPRTDLT